mgnify:CR=1 FL=1
MSEPTLAYRTHDPLEAHALAARLEETGIAARVVGDHLAGAFGTLTSSSVATAEVWIDEEDAAAAEEAVTRWRDANLPQRSVAPSPTWLDTWGLVLLVAGLTAGSAYALSITHVPYILQSAIGWLSIVLMTLAIGRFVLRDRRRSDAGSDGDAPDWISPPPLETGAFRPRILTGGRFGT